MELSDQVAPDGSRAELVVTQHVDMNGVGTDRPQPALVSTTSTVIHRLDGLFLVAQSAGPVRRVLCRQPTFCCLQSVEGAISEGFHDNVMYFTFDIFVLDGTSGAIRRGTP